VPLDAFLLVLGSATLHAVWNVLLAGAPDTRAATAGALAILAAVCLPLAVVTWDFEAQVLPYITASVVLEIAYFVLLAAAYSRADLGVVYPIARGAAPVLVLVAAFVAGRGDPSALQVAGVVLVAAGVVILRGGAAPAEGRDVVLALAVGATIAGYILADDAGLDHAATLPYLCVVVGVPGLVYAAAYAASAGRRSVHTLGFATRLGLGLVDARRRRRAGRRHAAREGAAALRAQITTRTATIAAAMVAALGLALAALELADPAPVAAIREGSVVIAAVLAPKLLGERGGRARLAGAAAVFAGVAAVAAG
jgi:drug/metabolite transporter (DMT)-like permease